jgi:hypothetical protein
MNLNERIKMKIIRIEYILKGILFNIVPSHLFFNRQSVCHSLGRRT